MFIRPELGGKVQDVYFSLHTVDIVLIFFHIQVLHEYWVLTESRIPLKPVLGGVRIVALSISSYLDVATTFLVSVRSC